MSHHASLFMKRGDLKLSEKRCNKCGRRLPLSRFYPKKNKLTGRCKDCIKEYNRQHYYAVRDDPGRKERVRKIARAWYLRDRDRINATRTEKTRAQRQRCLDAYGGRCACCGESRYEFLAIDHVNGGGCKHRADVGNKICRWLVKNNFPPGFQVLCHNCNQALGHYGYCPHEKERGQDLLEVV